VLFEIVTDHVGTAGSSPHERDARAYIAPKLILLYYDLTLYFFPTSRTLF
jgi:hypothetical protein